LVISSTNSSDVADDDELETKPPLLRTNSGRLVEPARDPPSRPSNKSLESEHADLTDSRKLS
jgi:hypothetical protein